MILDTETKIKIGPSNVSFYKKLGYNAIIGNFLTIDIKHLKPYSNILINVKCDICSKQRQIEYYVYIRGTKNKKEEYCCSIKCSQNKQKKTKLERYGDENYSNREKSEKTCLEKYGEKNVFFIEEIRNKAKKTMLEKYGSEYAFQNKKIYDNFKEQVEKKYGKKQILSVLEIRNKISETKLERYGDENYLNNEKAKKTKLERYGDENYSNREKSEKTCLEKFKNGSYFQSDEFKKRMLSIFGCEIPLQNKEIKNKQNNTNVKKYGCKSPLQNSEIFEKQQKSAKKLRFHENTGLYYRGSYEAHFLDYCFENKIKVERAKSIKYHFKNKKRVYYPDFFLKEKNLIIEIKSLYTYKKELEKNIAKQKACIEQGFNFIFIIDKDYSFFK